MANIRISDMAEADVRMTFGSLIDMIKADMGFYGKALVKCVHCGHWAAIMTECHKCGAPVDPDDNVSRY
jgi:hypothetical protein